MHFLICDGSTWKSSLFFSSTGDNIRLDDDPATGGAGCIRYDSTGSKLQYANDCATWTNFGSGGTSAGPAFHVDRNGTDQTGFSPTAKKITWTNEVFDTNNDFAGSIFTPTVAGKYIFHLSVGATSAAPSDWVGAYIYKNGAAVAANVQFGPNGGLITATTDVVLDMNGTTDYVEAYANMGTQTVVNGTSTWFEGSMFGGAGGSGGATALSDLTDVNTTGVTAGSLLMYSGGNWVPGGVNFTSAGGTDVSFSVYATSNQSIAAGAYPALDFQAKRFDSNNNFDLTTDRFTPTVAGKYVLTVSAGLSSLSAGKFSEACIRKNGTEVVWGSESAAGSENWSTAAVVVDANGTSDYFEACLENFDTVARSTNASDPSYVTFSGALVGGAGSGSGGTPGGSDTQIQFNSGGSFAGDSNFIWDSANAKLSITGNIDYTGTITDVSDRRLKENLKPLQNSLEGILTLQGYSFSMKSDPKHEIEYGLMAQDVQPVFPELVKTKPNGTLSLNYIGMIGPMVEAIKTQQKQIDDQRVQIDALSKANANLDTRLKALEDRYGTGAQ